MHRVPQVEALLASGDETGAERVLLEIAEATEAADRISGVAPWCYERLAILYRKQHRHDDEIAILERFAGQRHASGKSPARLLTRLRECLTRRDATPHGS